jgi:hypothetical protein
MPQPQTGTEASDRDLEKRILNYLSRFYLQVSRRVQVKASQGFVTLMGTVRSYYHRQLCLEFAKKVDGVTAVSDCLTVAGGNDAGHQGDRSRRLNLNRPHCLESHQVELAPMG